MDSLVGYGSDDDNETERRHHNSYRSSGPSGATGSNRRRDDDTNYDDVNMDMSEDSQAESEPELPPAEPSPPRPSRPSRHGSEDSRGSRERRRESPARTASSRARSERERERDHDRRESRRDDRHHRSERERSRGHDSGSSRRGLLGDRPDERSGNSQVPALMDLKPFGGEAPPSYSKSQDARDAVSPRFVDRGERRGERNDRDRERERDRERHSRRSEERRSSSRRDRERRSRSRGPAPPPPAPHASSSIEKRNSPPTNDYRPSYKVNKKLEVMEKMGLQIKTPDGSMATAQQLRAAAGDPAPHCGPGLPSYYNPTAINTNKILDQVNKRKLLWSSKNKCEAEEAAKWSGTRFAQDSDGKQANKFMRLMGIKEPGAVKPEPDKTVDPIKKQEELFQAMQAQYEVARATTHTMRGVGLGFQRGQF